MKKILSWAVLAVLLMSCNSQVNGQASDNAEETLTREDRILANLRFKIPQLREVFVQMDAITPSDIDGLEADPKRVVQLNGSPTDNNATLFREGYFSIASPHYDAGDWELVDDQAVPDWDNQQALTIYEQILTAAGGDVDATFAANDGLANSVISALKTQGLEPMPVSFRTPGDPPRATEPFASTAMIRVSGLVSRKYRPMPASVPPVETATKTASTLCPICRSISGAVPK